MQNAEPAPPSIEGYHDFSVIGTGGFSTVWSATEVAFNRKVAIKVIESPGHEARRLEREALALGALAGIPGVLQPHAVTATEDGRPCLVLPLMASSIATEVAGGGPIDPEVVLRWTSVLAEALDEVHRRGIFHRDVKPQNVLVDAQGQPYLADFGIAALSDLTNSTATAFSVSPPHAPPERLLAGEGTVDADPAAGDRYSFASTVFTALAALPPFGTAADGGPAGLINRITTADPVRPVSMTPAVHDVFRRALAKDPSDRFPTCVEFATQLEAAVHEASDATIPRVTPLQVPPPPVSPEAWYTETGTTGEGADPPSMGSVSTVPPRHPDTPSWTAPSVPVAATAAPSTPPPVVGLPSTPVAPPAVPGGAAVPPPVMSLPSAPGTAPTTELPAVPPPAGWGGAAGAPPLGPPVGPPVVPGGSPMPGGAPPMSGAVGTLGEPATWGQRFAATLLDSLIGVAVTAAAWGAVWGIMTMLGRQDDAGLLVAAVVVLTFDGLILAAYRIVGDSMGRQTVGRRAMGIRVVRADGGDLRRWHVVGRNLATFISSLPLMIGWLMPLWDPKREALHDKIAHTSVRRYTGTPAKGGLFRAVAISWVLVVAGSTVAGALTPEDDTSDYDYGYSLDGDGSTDGPGYLDSEGYEEDYSGGVTLEACSADDLELVADDLEISAEEATLTVVFTNSCSSNISLGSGSSVELRDSSGRSIIDGTFDLSMREISGDSTQTMSLNYLRRESPSSWSERFSRLSSSTGGSGTRSLGVVWSIPCQDGSGSSFSVSDATQTSLSVSGDAGSATATTGVPPGDDAAARAELERIRAADRSTVESLVGSWIPQLSAKKEGLVAEGRTYSASDVLADHQMLRSRYPGAVLLWSGDFNFKNDDFWVTVVADPYGNHEPVLSWCASEGIGRDDCLAKRLLRQAYREGDTKMQPR